MPPLSDPKILSQFREVARHYETDKGFHWTDVALENLAKVDGPTRRGVERALCQHIQAKRAIRQVAETRPNWKNQWTHHYDVTLNFPDVKLYVEMRLDDRRASQVTILVANTHEDMK